MQSGFTQAYQPLVDLVIEEVGAATLGTRTSDALPQDPTHRVSRTLDLATATARHEWSTARHAGWAETFVSYHAQALVWRRTWSETVDVDLSLSSPHPTARMSVGAEGIDAVVRMPSTVIPFREDTDPGPR